MKLPPPDRLRRPYETAARLCRAERSFRGEVGSRRCGRRVGPRASRRAAREGHVDVGSRCPPRGRACRRADDEHERLAQAGRTRPPTVSLGLDRRRPPSWRRRAQRRSRRVDRGARRRARPAVVRSHGSGSGDCELAERGDRDPCRTSFAAYSAWSAARSSAVGVAPSKGYVEMPAADPKREPGVREALGEDASGSALAERLGGVGARAREHDDELVAAETRRVGALRAATRSRTSATSRRSASPNSCPARSLISLKSSQSMTSRLSGARCSWAVGELRAPAAPRDRGG